MEPSRRHVFNYVDYIVFGCTVLVSIAIGFYHAFCGGKQRTTSEYFLAGQSMTFLPTALSLIVSFESSIMMVGLPAEVYIYGIQYIISIFAWCTALFLSAFVMVPLIHPLKIASAYEYLELRFKSRKIRLLGTFLGMLQYIWYMGIVLFGPAVALQTVTGFHQWISIFVISLAAVVYTSIGGLKAVIWTDVFQTVIMLTGMIAILIKGTIDSEGTEEVLSKAEKGGRFNFFNFDLDPRVRHTFWGLYIGNFLRATSRIFNQSTIQRVSATSSIATAKKVMMLAGPGMMILSCLAVFEGIVAYAYYDTIHCDPFASGELKSPNEIIPYMVMDIFHGIPGMPGLFLASLFSATLSTLSSGLSSLSILTWEDFFSHYMPEASELKATVIAKFSVVVYGILACGVAVLVSQIGGTLTQIADSILAAFVGPLSGLFLLGSLCPWANAKGTLIGGSFASCIMLWICLGSSFSPAQKMTPWLTAAPTDQCPVHNTTFSSLQNTSYSLIQNVTESTPTTNASDYHIEGIDVMYSLSYTWFTCIGIFIVISVGSVTSLLTGANWKDPVDPKYLIPLCDRLCCYLPFSFRRLFRCGVDYASAKAKRSDDIFTNQLNINSEKGKSDENDDTVETTFLNNDS